MMDNVKKKVRFFNRVSVILIPTLTEYRQFDLWYNISDYYKFTNNFYKNKIHMNNISYI